MSDERPLSKRTERRDGAYRRLPFAYHLLMFGPLQVVVFLVRLDVSTKALRAWIVRKIA